MAEKLDHASPSNNAWASLLGLLSPSEYFVTVDHSVLWQRHVAWAKPKGEDLRQYVTQRFASNMVVLSLMLGAEINVFFNSSIELSEMRSLLAAEAYGDLKFWIGIVIALDSCVTIMALVATFTLWGMISSISDANTHALLRSSIGQYVISMPPRFVVAALYLFICWFFLALMDFTCGLSRIVLALVVIFLFFQVIIPLSAFGRLIIHTGAMAKRRVLEEDFEKELLPSGLHASLLIRATGQRRKYTSAIHQYRKRPKSSRTGQPATASKISSGTSDLARNSRVSPTKSIVESSPVNSTFMTDSERENNHSGRSVWSVRSVQSTTIADGRNFYGSLGMEEEPQILESARLLQPDRQSSTMRDMSDSFATSTIAPSTASAKLSKSHHRRTESGDVSFPLPCVLNAVNSSDLRGVVQRAITESLSLDILEEGFGSGEDQTTKVECPQKKDYQENRPPKRNLTAGTGGTNEGDGKRNSRTRNSAGSSSRPHHERRSSSSRKVRQGSIRRRPSSTTSSGLAAEWAEENSVRNLYNETEPIIFFPDDLGGQGIEEAEAIRTSNRPRPSLLNRAWSLQALNDLLIREDLDTPESSVTEEDDIRRSRHRSWPRDT